MAPPEAPEFSFDGRLGCSLELQLGNAMELLGRRALVGIGLTVTQADL
jgi:hypothetical protein